MIKRLMSTKELSEYLGTSRAGIYQMLFKRQIPPACVVKLGRALRFEVSEIDKWLNARRLS